MNTAVLNQPVSVLDQLKSSPAKERFVKNPVLRKLRVDTLTPEQATVVVGQYWYPIEYFTTFLPKVIASSPKLAIKTLVSKVLWQELGEGDVAKSHETLYIDTMVDNAKMPYKQVCEAPLLEATKRLMDGYHQSTDNFLDGIGFLFATEEIDLPIVSSLSKAVRKATGEKNLPWLDIHVKQEPDHTDNMAETVSSYISDEEAQYVVQAAEKMWDLWNDFFLNIGSEIFPTES